MGFTAFHALPWTSSLNTEPSNPCQHQAQPSAPLPIRPAPTPNPLLCMVRALPVHYIATVYIATCHSSSYQLLLLFIISLIVCMVCPQYPVYVSGVDEGELFGQERGTANCGGACYNATTRTLFWVSCVHKNRAEWG